MTVACVLIVSQKRVPLVREKVLPVVLSQGFDEVFWVGDGEPGDGYRFLHVPDLTKTTDDALVKRDVGTLASSAEAIVYLCDDHRPRGDFLTVLRNFTAKTDKWDIIAPNRFTMHNGERVPLNMGWNDARDPNCPYLAGHGGVFRRSVIVANPWTAGPRGRVWDLHSSRYLMSQGYQIVGLNHLWIEDLEPEAEPWR